MFIKKENQQNIFLHTTQAKTMKGHAIGESRHADG